MGSRPPGEPGNPEQLGSPHHRDPGPAPTTEPAWYDRGNEASRTQQPGGWSPEPGAPWGGPVPPHPSGQPEPAWYDRGDPQPSPSRDPGDDDLTERERFHPAFMLMTLVRSIRGFIFPIAIALFSGSRGEFLWLGIAGAFAALTIVNAVATWWMSSYQVTATSLRLRTGWLNRQERSVSFERIQTIDLQEPPLARALGVAQLRVETAAGGGSAADIVIEALTTRDAAALRNELLAERARHTGRTTAAGTTAPETIPGQPAATADPSPTVTDPGQVIGRLSGRELLIAGMTSGRIGPAAAILAAVSQFGGDLIQNVGRGILGPRFDEIVDWGAGAPVQGILLLIFILGLGAWALSILGTVLSFSGFTLRRDDDQLLVSTGLLDRRRTTIPLHRIQSITVREGLIRQPFGLVSVHFVSAGYGGGQQNADSGVLFPLIRRRDVAALLASAVPGFSADIEAVRTSGNRLPRRALPRYVVPALAWDVVTLAVALVVAWLVPFTEWWWGFVVVLIASTPWQWLAYHDTRWQWDAEQRLIVQGRSVARSVTIIPRRRVQNRELRQNWFQRRARLATLVVRVAGATFGNSVTIAHLDADEATDLAGQLALHDVPRRKSRQRGQARATGGQPQTFPANDWR